MPRKTVLRATALLVCCWALPAAAQNSVAHFYRGKTITIVIGTEAGGGYDAYARLMGRYLGKHIPGHPNVVATNMPGAGSEQAASYVARVAPKDGTFIAATEAAQPIYPILENAADLNYDPSRMNYLGSALKDDYLCIVRPDAPATTFAAVFKTRIIIGGSYANEQSGMMPIMYDNLLGTKFKVVLGYPGMRNITLALEKGEVQGTCGMGWLTLKSHYAHLLKDKIVKILVQENAKGFPELNKKGIPLTVSYARNDEQRRILDIVYAQEAFARPYFVAAGIPADRVQALRRAFVETWRDPALLKEAARLNFDVGLTSGEDVQARVKKIYASPPALIQKVKEAIKPK